MFVVVGIILNYFYKSKEFVKRWDWDYKIDVFYELLCIFFCKIVKVFNLVLYINEILGLVDMIINCVGLGFYMIMKNCFVDDWEKMIDVNCKV